MKTRQKPTTATFAWRTGGAAAITLLLASASFRGVDAQDSTDARVARAERAAEARYKKLMSTRPGTAKDWYMIGDWCAMVAADLSDRGRETFMRRSEECMQQGKRFVLVKLEDLLGEGLMRVKKSDSHDRAVRVKAQVEAQVDAFVGELLPIVKQHRSQMTIISTLESGLAALEEALKPFEIAEKREKARSGLVEVRGQWIRFDERIEGFEGFVPLDRLARSPGRYVGKLLSTELASSLQLYQLLDRVLLDGFDPKGGYLVPNFADERLIITVPPRVQNVILDCEAIEQRSIETEAAGSARATLFKTRAVLRLEPASKQHTKFYEGKIEFLSVVDGTDQVMVFASSK